MRVGICGDGNGPVDVSRYSGKVKVACVGDSITFGYGISKGNSYPLQLQRMLGEKFEVRNFGVNSTTLLNKGDNPYEKEKAMGAAVEFEPDVVVIMLGTNDTKPLNWKYEGDFAADYKELAGRFLELKSHPRIWLAHPCPVPADGKWD